MGAKLVCIDDRLYLVKVFYLRYGSKIIISRTD